MLTLPTPPNMGANTQAVSICITSTVIIYRQRTKPSLMIIDKNSHYTDSSPSHDSVAAPKVRTLRRRYQGELGTRCIAASDAMPTTRCESHCHEDQINGWPQCAIQRVSSRSIPDNMFASEPCTFRALRPSV